MLAGSRLVEFISGEVDSAPIPDVLDHSQQALSGRLMDMPAQLFSFGPMVRYECSIKKRAGFRVKLELNMHLDPLQLQNVLTSL